MGTVVKDLQALHHCDEEGGSKQARGDQRGEDGARLNAQLCSARLITATCWLAKGPCLPGTSVAMTGEGYIGTR